MFRRKHWQIYNVYNSNKKVVIRTDKKGEEVAKNISYVLQFIDSTRFMASSLLNFVNTYSEGIHRIKCKFGDDDKKCETCGIRYKYCNCFLEYKTLKDDLIEYKCLYCNKNYQHKFDEKLKKRFLKHTNFLTSTIISLFYYCKKSFILMNIWMIKKNSVKHHYLEKKIYTVISIWKMLLMQIMRTEKFVNTFK